MNSAERQQALLEHLAARGRATVQELARLLQVSDDTIRRDLQQLSHQGFLQKKHGEAVLLDVPRMDRATRQQVLPGVKLALGRQVASSIQAGTTLMLDAGGSCLAVAAALEVPVTVITPSLDIAVALSSKPQVKLVVLGGTWDASQRLLGGPQALEHLRRYRADLAILGACAVHARFGVTATEEGDAHLKQGMLQGSEQHWLLADHLKFDQHGPHFVAPLTAFDLLFTDQPPPFDPGIPLQVVPAPGAQP